MFANTTAVQLSPGQPKAWQSNKVQQRRLNCADQTNQADVARNGLDSDVSLGGKQLQEKLISLAVYIRETTYEVTPYQPLNYQRWGSAERCNQRGKTSTTTTLPAEPIFIFLLLSHGKKRLKKRLKKKNLESCTSCGNSLHPNLFGFYFDPSVLVSIQLLLSQEGKSQAQALTERPGGGLWYFRAL